MQKSLSQSIETRWRKMLSVLLVLLTVLGMLPTTALASDATPAYEPTGDFEVNVAGSTGWNAYPMTLPVYDAEEDGKQIAVVPAADENAPIAFVILEDNGGDRVKVGLAYDGSTLTSWTGGSVTKTGWVDKESIFVNLPDVLPSIAYDLTGREDQYSVRLGRYEHIVPCWYTLAEFLAESQKEAMSNGETLLVYDAGNQTADVNLAKGGPAELHDYEIDGAKYQKYEAWTDTNRSGRLEEWQKPFSTPANVTRVYSVSPYTAFAEVVGRNSVRRAPARAASNPTGGTGGLNPGSPGGQKPTSNTTAWYTDQERTFLSFTLVEFPEGVVTDLNSNSYNTWHVVGHPLNVVWGKGKIENWNADQCRSKITWFNSCAMQYNGAGSDAKSLMSGTVYSYDATAGENKRWVTTADEFQAESGITDQQKEQMFHCNSSSWTSGWKDGDYTSMWGTDPENVTPGNPYKVYKANDAFIYLLGRLSETGTAGSGWSKDEAIDKWSEYIHDADGNLRTKYRVIVETGGVVVDPDGVRRAYTLREMMAYTQYNNEANAKNNLIYDQSSTIKNMSRWMRQSKDNQFLEYPLDSSGTPTGEELHSINGFREADSFVDSITSAAKIRDTIFSERRSYGLHIFSPFNFESTIIKEDRVTLDVTKSAEEGLDSGDGWSFTLTYTAGTPKGFTAKKNGTDCTSEVTDTGSGLTFKLKDGETIHFEFDADTSFRCEVREDDTSNLTDVSGTGGAADKDAGKFTTDSTAAKVTFTNGNPPPPPPPDEDDPPPEETPSGPSGPIVYKRDAMTNSGVGPATFKFASVVNGDYEFTTDANGELEPIQWWNPKDESEGRYIKPGEYAVSEIVPPPNYMPTTEVQQIKLELDDSGNGIPAGPLVSRIWRK